MTNYEITHSLTRPIGKEMISYIDLERKNWFAFRAHGYEKQLSEKG